VAIDPARVYTAAERAAAKPRCPECRAPIALTWRRVQESGRSEDLFRIAKASCPNRCDVGPADIET
jgi:hypothetical protein